MQSSVGWDPLGFLKKRQKKVPKRILMKFARAYAYQGDLKGLQALKVFVKQNYKGARFHLRWAISVRLKRIRLAKKAAAKRKRVAARRKKAAARVPTRGLRRTTKSKVRKTRAIKRIAKKAIRSKKHYYALKLAARLRVPMAARFLKTVGRVRILRKMAPLYLSPPPYEDDYYEDDYYEDDYYYEDEGYEYGY